MLRHLPGFLQQDLSMRKLLAIAVAVVLVLTFFVGAIGWYFSGRVLDVTQAEATTVRILRSDAATVTFERNDIVEAKGVFGLRWSGGSAFVDDVLARDSTSITRPVREIRGALPTSGTVTWDRHLWDGDPRETIGLDYENITLRSDAGDLPTWLVPGSASTWIIAVHGRSSERDAALRVLPFLHRNGFPVLIPAYRNGENAAPSPDDKDHLGDTEWRDIDAAMTYARDHGAQQVVLYGWSKGGAIVMTALRRSSQKELINGVILDAPVLSWHETLELQGKQRHLNEPLIAVAKQFVEQRAGLELDDFDQAEYAPGLTVPVLVFHSLSDTSVPVQSSIAFAEANRARIRLELFSDASHTAEWNADATRYEAVLGDFLVPLR